MSKFIGMLMMVALTCTGVAQAAAREHSNHSIRVQSDEDPHAGHRMGKSPEAPRPAAAHQGPDHAADLYFDPGAMATSREQLRTENGAMRTAANIFDRLEKTSGDGDDRDEGYAWDIQGWFGGDVRRLWWKSEGEGAFSEALDDAELQLLYGQAVNPYFDFQVGVRQVHTSGPDRSDLVIGVQGLAPYWFEVDAAAFLSSKGELRARAETEYDLRLTQRLILQARAELNLSAEDIPELNIAAGINSVELGMRVRYEVSRQFAPYAGLEWTGATGDTRDLIRQSGQHPDETSLVVGIKAWF